MKKVMIGVLLASASFSSYAGMDFRELLKEENQIEKKSDIKMGDLFEWMDARFCEQNSKIA